MSGDYYYRTNGSTGNGGTARSTGSVSDHSIASAAGEILVGAAAVTAVALGALLAGMIKGGIAIAKAGKKAYKKRKEQNAAAENDLRRIAKEAVERRERAEKEAAAGYRQQINGCSRSSAVPGQKATEFVRAAKEKRQIAEREADRLDKELAERLSTLERNIADRCAENAANSCEQMIREWQSQRKEISKQEIYEIDKRLKEVHRSMTESLSNLRQKDGLRVCAEQSLADARCVLEELIGLPGAANFSRSECSMLVEKLKHASQSYDEGNYAMSFAESCDLVLQTREVYLDTLDKYNSSCRKAGQLMIDLASLTEAADITEVSFIHKGESLRDDLYRFCPSWWDAVRGELNAVFPLIRDGMSDVEINDVGKKLKEARNDYLTVYRYAWDKLLSSYNVNDIANSSVSLLSAQGYQVEDSAYEGGAVEGEECGPLHINLTNPITDDRITVVIDADSANNVQASLHQFGAPDRLLPDEEKQRRLMELIGSGIRSNTGQRVSVTCNTPHGNSKQYEQADLQVQRKKQKKTG